MNTTPAPTRQPHIIDGRELSQPELQTPLTADYVGNLRHECPRCHRAAAIRPLFEQSGKVTEYCEHSSCGWERVMTYTTAEVTK